MVPVRSPVTGGARCDVLVMGAGAIGLYVGGRLAQAGLDVHFVARPALVATLDAAGLTTIALDGASTTVDRHRFSLSTSPDGAPLPRLVLLCVKGLATAEAAAQLQNALPPGTPVLSFQNGVDNVERIRRAAPGLVPIAGMVPFNVVQQAAGACVRQTTSGELAVARCAISEQWVGSFERAGMPLQLHADMRPVQWGKLLLNLNNPLNALAGVPLVAELEDRTWRGLLADLQAEALDALARAGIRPARVTPLPTRWLPPLLRLPTPLFRLLARRMLSIDPAARSSMYDDRVRGRPTEIDDLCGAVVRLADAFGGDAPFNRALIGLIRSAPAERYFSAAEVALTLALAAGKGLDKPHANG